MDNKKVIAIVAIFLIVIVGVMLYYRSPIKPQDSQNQTSDTQTPTSNQIRQKTRTEYIVKVTTSSPHFGAAIVYDENDHIVCEKKFENNDEATVTNEYKISAGAGDEVIVEVQFGGYVTVRLVKEGLIFDKTIASKTDFDGIIFRYTIKEDDM